MKRLLLLVLALGLAAISYMALSHTKLVIEWRTERSLKRLGQASYSPEAWKAAGPEARAQMAYDLVTRRSVHGMPRTELLEELGPMTSYHLSEEHPAYSLGRPLRLVFYTDASDRIHVVELICSPAECP